MPIHDWTRVDAGLFHAFHQQWVMTLCNGLNAGALPPDYFALPEQSIRGPIPDVLTLRLSADRGEESDRTGGVAVATRRPRVHLTKRFAAQTDLDEIESYPTKASRISVRHRHGEVVAVVEIVSPGNKASRREFRSFVDKSAELIRQEVHLLVIDLLPPTSRDPQGIHKAIWDEIEEDEFQLPPGRPLTLASYDAGPETVAYAEFVAVGDPLPEMPLFLRPGFYVPAPLEATYQSAWDVFPAPLKGLLEP